MQQDPELESSGQPPEDEHRDAFHAGRGNRSDGPQNPQLSGSSARRRSPPPIGLFTSGESIERTLIVSAQFEDLFAKNLVDMSALAQSLANVNRFEKLFTANLVDSSALAESLEKIRKIEGLFTTNLLDTSALTQSLTRTSEFESMFATTLMEASVLTARINEAVDVQALIAASPKTADALEQAFAGADAVLEAFNAIEMPTSVMGGIAQRARSIADALSSSMPPEDIVANAIPSMELLSFQTKGIPADEETFVGSEPNYQSHRRDERLAVRVTIAFYVTTLVTFFAFQEPTRVPTATLAALSGIFFPIWWWAFTVGTEDSSV